MELSDLESVLYFMYHGEVQVAQEGLNSFLEIAKDLKIKGLTQETADRNKKTNVVESSVAKESKHADVLQEDRTAANIVNEPVHVHDDQQYDDGERLHVKTEPGQSSLTESNTVQDMYEDQGLQYDWYGDQHKNEHDEQEEIYQESLLEMETHKELLDMMIIKSGNQFKCSECGRSFIVKSQCRRHVQNVHSKQKELCPICHKFMKNQTTLKSHLRGTHGVYQK